MIQELINRPDFKIETERLTITAVNDKSALNFFNYFDADITQYQYPEPFNSLESTKEFIKEYTNLRKAGTDLICDVFDKRSNFIGSVEIHMLDSKTPELGVWICKEHQRKGYGYESLSTLIEFIRNNADIDYFIYEGDRRNIGTIRLIEALGGIYKNFNIVKTDAGKELELNMYYITSKH